MESALVHQKRDFSGRPLTTGTSRRNIDIILEVAGLEGHGGNKCCCFADRCGAVAIQDFENRAHSLHSSSALLRIGCTTACRGSWSYSQDVFRTQHESATSMYSIRRLAVEWVTLCNCEESCDQRKAWGGKRELHGVRYMLFCFPEATNCKRQEYG